MFAVDVNKSSETDCEPNIYCINERNKADPALPEDGCLSNPDQITGNESMEISETPSGTIDINSNRFFILYFPIISKNDCIFYMNRQPN